MSRLKKSISAAVGAILVAMMLLTLGAGEIEAGAKNRQGRSARQKPGATSAGASQPSHARSAHAARRSGILPYIEQDNLYNRRRP